MAVEIIIFHDQSPRKYGTEPGSNSQLLDMQPDTYLQSDKLLTVLHCQGPGPDKKNIK